MASLKLFSEQSVRRVKSCESARVGRSAAEPQRHHPAHFSCNSRLGRDRKDGADSANTWPSRYIHSQRRRRANRCTIRRFLMSERAHLSLLSNEGFVRLDKRIGRNNELCIARLAQAQDVLAAHVLLLEQGKLEHKVRLNIDVHVATSYSIRPFLTASSKPVSTNQLCPLLRFSGCSAKRMRSPNQAATTKSVHTRLVHSADEILNLTRLPTNASVPMSCGSI